jgi:hypothetical protein
MQLLKLVAATSLESIWMLTDRRLSFPARFRDDARKMMALETNDGLALLGYAGLVPRQMIRSPATG